MHRDRVIATLLHAALFGSVARGQAEPGGDMDIRIEIAPGAPVGVFEYVGITQYIGDLFDERVDVADRGSLTPLVRPAVEADAMYAF
jgi:predicted nucleotidyltransferase